MPIACRSTSLLAMEDLGPPASYMTLAEGVEVYSSDGQGIGKVAHVLADPDLDVFDGFVIDTAPCRGDTGSLTQPRWTRSTSEASC